MSRAATGLRLIVIASPARPFRYRAGLLLLSLLLVVPLFAQAAEESVIGPPHTRLEYLRSPGLLRLYKPARDEFPAQAELVRAFDSGRYQLASETADALLAEITAEFGEDSTQRVPPLINKATVAYAAQQHQVAEQAYTQALSLLAKTTDVRDSRQVRPLYGLGLSYYAQGKYREAAEVFYRAIFITRTQLGLKSYGQLVINKALMETLLALGAREEIVKRQRFALGVVAQAAGQSSTEYIDALEQAAAWFRRIGDYENEQKMHLGRIDLLEQLNGRESPSLIDPLLDLVDTDIQLLTPGLRPLANLRRALAIAKANPSLAAEKKAHVQLALGDYSLLINRQRTAEKYYQEAYETLADGGATQALESLRGNPKLIFFPYPQPEAGNRQLPPGAWPSGEASMQFSVDERGHTRNINIEEFRPDVVSVARTWVPKALRAMRLSRYRPRVTEQGTVKTENTVHRYRFRYRPSEQPSQ